MLRKILLRTLMILLVAGLVTAGLYLFVEKGGMSAVGRREGPGFMGGRGAHREGFAEGERPAGLEGDAFAEGELMHRDHHGLEGQAGFSLAGLGGVAAQAGKIAIITLLVVGVQGLVRLFNRPRKTEAAPAAETAQ